MRRLVFVGDCQVQSIGRVFAALPSSQEILATSVRSYERFDAKAREVIARADVLVLQVQSFEHAELASIPTGATRYYVPLVSGRFLWPFVGTPHPNYPPTKVGLTRGYPVEQT